VAIYFRDKPTKKILEAWPKGGVQAVDGWLTNHKAGTPVDLFVFRLQPTQENVRLALEWATEQIGKRYDWRGVIKFLTRAPGEYDDDWFCSEYGAEIAVKARAPLSNIPSYEMSPRDVAASARLLYLGEYRV